MSGSIFNQLPAAADRTTPQTIKSQKEIKQDSKVALLKQISQQFGQVNPVDEKFLHQRTTSTSVESSKQIPPPPPPPPIGEPPISSASIDHLKKIQEGLKLKPTKTNDRSGANLKQLKKQDSTENLVSTNTKEAAQPLQPTTSKKTVNSGSLVIEMENLPATTLNTMSLYDAKGEEGFMELTEKLFWGMELAYIKDELNRSMKSEITAIENAHARSEGLTIVESLLNKSMGALQSLINDQPIQRAPLIIQGKEVQRPPLTPQELLRSRADGRLLKELCLKDKTGELFKLSEPEQQRSRNSFLSVINSYPKLSSAIVNGDLKKAQIALKAIRKEDSETLKSAESSKLLLCLMSQAEDAHIRANPEKNPSKKAPKWAEASKQPLASRLKGFKNEQLNTLDKKDVIDRCMDRMAEKVLQKSSGSLESACKEIRQTYKIDSSASSYRKQQDPMLKNYLSSSDLPKHQQDALAIDDLHEYRNLVSGKCSKDDINQMVIESAFKIIDDLVNSDDMSFSEKWKDVKNGIKSKKKK